MQLSVQIEISFFKPSYNINIQIYRTNWLRYKQWWEFRSGRNQQFRRVMHRTIYSSASAKPRRWLLIFFFWEREKEAKTHTAVCVRGSRWNVRGSWSPHITTLEEKQKKLYYLRKVFIIRPDSSRPRTGSSASGWLKLPRWSLVHIWRASVTTRKWGVCAEPKEKTLKDKTLHSHSPFTLLPSDQRYRSIRCRTTRRLLSYNSAHPKQFLCKIKKGQLSLCNPRIHLNREYTIPATIVVLLIIAGLSFALS